MKGLNGITLDVKEETKEHFGFVSHPQTGIPTIYQVDEEHPTVVPNSRPIELTAWAVGKKKITIIFTFKEG